MRWWFVLPFLAAAVPAQLGRYELGRRLRLFEQAWEKVDPAGRARATPHLEAAVRAFFGLNVPVAAAAIERGRRALAAPDGGEGEVGWAAGLAFAPAPRLVEPGSTTLRVTTVRLFEGEDDPPGDVRVRCELLGPYDKVVAPAVTGTIAEAESGLSLDLDGVADGDYTLHGRVLAGDVEVVSARIGVSVARGITQQLATMDVIAKAIPADAIDPDATTLRFLLDTLRAGLEGKIAETDLPYARMLGEAMAVARRRVSGGSYYASAPVGEHWMCLAAETRRIPVRLFAPPRRTPGQKLPLVVALHGAGGSENMFFDAYGAGKLIARAYERDWMVVAPKNAGGQIATIIDEVARLFPVDRGKVFLVGHSMGAMQAITAATSDEVARYAGVVALGGGGRVPKDAKLAGRRFFVGVGSRDFARSGALALSDALGAAGADVRFEEYPDVEHLTIVQRALDDVFAWLDAIAQSKRGG